MTKVPLSCGPLLSLLSMDDDRFLPSTSDVSVTMDIRNKLCMSVNFAGVNDFDVLFYTHRIMTTNHIMSVKKRKNCVDHLV